MAHGDEEEKSFGKKLLLTWARMAGKLPSPGVDPSGPIPRTTYTLPLPPSESQSLLDTPDPLALPGPVGGADPSEYRGASNPKLFEAGLVGVNGALTDTGRMLATNAQKRGKDYEKMVDYYARGFITPDLQVTESGKIFESVDRTTTLDSVFKHDKREGFRLYKQAAASGALDLYNERMGMDAETTEEFLGEAAKQFIPELRHLWPIVRDFPGGVATLSDLMVRENAQLVPDVASLTLLGRATGLPSKLWGLLRGKLTDEEQAELAFSKDEYLREGLFRMASTYSNGFAAALTHSKATRHLFSDEQRLLSIYHYRKDQWDIERYEAGQATGEVLGFFHDLKKSAYSDIAYFDGKESVKAELAEGEEKVRKAAQNVEDAVGYLNELDLIDNIDLSKPLDQRQQSRVEKVKQYVLPVATILSPDVLASVGLGSVISAPFKATSKIGQLSAKATRLSAAKRATDAAVIAAKEERKLAAMFPLAKPPVPPTLAGIAKMEALSANYSTQIAKLQKRLGRLDGTIPGPIAGALGGAVRAVTSAPFKLTGAAAQATGKLLSRVAPGIGGVATGLGAGLLAAGPLGWGAAPGVVIGTLMGLGSRGRILTRFGEKMSRVGVEFASRRMVYPYWRKLAMERKANPILRNAALAQELVIGGSIQLTKQFAELWRNAFIGEIPFSYIAAGGASQAGGNWLAQAAAEALLIEAPIIGGGRLVGRAAGMKMSGNVADHNRFAYNAALNFRDQFLTDPAQRAAFDALPPIVKRMYGNAYTGFPDLRVEFTETVAEGAGFFDPDSNTIVINPADHRGVEAIMAHEFRHYLDTEGFTGAVINAAVGPRGFLRQKPAEDSATGVGDLIPEFRAWAEDYNRIRVASGRRPYDLTNHEDLGQVALEWSAYSSMDSITEGLRNNVLIEWSRRHPWVRGLYDGIMGPFFRQGSLMNAGLLFDENGNLAVREGLPGAEAYKKHPAIAARIERMVKDKAGIGFTVEERADLDSPDNKKRSPDSIGRENTEALKEVEADLIADLKTDKDGKPILVNGVAELKQEAPGRQILPNLPDQNFERQTVNVGRGKDNGVDLTAGLTKIKDPTRDVVPGEPTELVPNHENVAALKQFFREGFGYNDLQLGMIDDLIDIMSDPDRRGEAVLGYYFPVWLTKRKKAREGNWMKHVPKKGLKAKWAKFAPYGLVQTQEGNVNVQAISLDQVVENAKIISTSRKGRELYDGDAHQILADFNEMVRNYGRNIANTGRFTRDKLELLNAVFGNVGKGHPEINTLLAQDPQISKVRSAVRTYRIERFTQLNSGIKAGFPFSLEKAKRMEMPAQDPQTGTPYFAAGKGPLLEGDWVMDVPEFGRIEVYSNRSKSEQERSKQWREFKGIGDVIAEETGARVPLAKVRVADMPAGVRRVPSFERPFVVIHPGYSLDPGDVKDMALRVFGKGHDGIIEVTSEKAVPGLKLNKSGELVTRKGARPVESLSDTELRDHIDFNKEGVNVYTWDTGDDIRGEVGPAEGSRALEMPAQDPQAQPFFAPGEPVVSMENIPGMDSKVMAGLHTATAATRTQFEDQIEAAIADPEHGDVFGAVMKEAGLLEPTGLKIAPRAYSIWTNSKGDLEINEAQQVGGFRNENEAKLYAAMRGLFMKQEAVAGMLPQAAGPKKAALFAPGKPLGVVEVKKVMRVVQDELIAAGLEKKHAEDFAFYPNPEGFALVHLGFNEDIDADLRDSVFEAVGEEVGLSDVGEFDTETFYIDNNWTTRDIQGDYGLRPKAPNGETFVSQIKTLQTALGSSDLLARVASRVGTRIQGVYDTFSQQGLGEAGLQPGVAPAAGSVGFRRTLTGQAMIPQQGPLGPVAVARRTGRDTPAPDLTTRQKVSSDLIPAVASELGAKARKNINLFRDKINRSVTKILGMGDLVRHTGVGARTRAMTNRLATNLVDLFNSVPANLVAEWRTWYNRANTWAATQAQRVYGMTTETVAGLTARMSPGSDWFNNLTMVDHMLSTFENNPLFTTQMRDHVIRKARNSYLDSEKGKNASTAERAQNLLNIEQRETALAAPFLGKRFLEILELDRTAASRVVRAHSEQMLGNRVRDETGADRTDDPGMGTLSWTSYTDIALALDMTRLPKQESMSLLLGDAHKIRSFYNNIVDPDDITYLDVTIDTHAVGAAHFAPFSQQAPEVLANFGSSSPLGTPTKNKASGLSGTYFVYADAYRIAADRLSQQLGHRILPRELQSVVWEAIRDFYPDSFKRTNVAPQVREILNQVPAGNLTMQQAVQQIEGIVNEWRATQTERGAVKINPIQALSPR